MQISDLLRSSVEDFYYEEADLLDAFLFREWLDLLADDISVPNSYSWESH